MIDDNIGEIRNSTKQILHCESIVILPRTVAKLKNKLDIGIDQIQIA